MKPHLYSLTLLAVLAAPAAHAVEYRTVLPKQSAISFEFRQMGVPVAGGFKRFTTQMVFDPARPEAASARIEIDLASIDAGSAEADEESAGKLWFNRSVYPKAQFVSSQVRALGNNRYEMRGTLTLKGKSRDHDRAGDVYAPARTPPPSTARSSSNVWSSASAKACGPMSPPSPTKSRSSSALPPPANNPLFSHF